MNIQIEPKISKRRMKSVRLGLGVFIRSTLREYGLKQTASNNIAREAINVVETVFGPVEDYPECLCGSKNMYTRGICHSCYKHLLGRKKKRG